MDNVTMFTVSVSDFEVAWNWYLTIPPVFVGSKVSRGVMTDILPSWMQLNLIQLI